MGVLGKALISGVSGVLRGRSFGYGEHDARGPSFLSCLPLVCVIRYIGSIEGLEPTVHLFRPLTESYTSYNQSPRKKTSALDTENIPKLEGPLPPPGVGRPMDTSRHVHGKNVHGKVHGHIHGHPWETSPRMAATDGGHGRIIAWRCPRRCMIGWRCP